MQQSLDTSKGLWLAIAGYVLWGIFPLYFFALRDVPPTEVLAHRLLWSMCLLLLISVFYKFKVSWLSVLKSKRMLAACALSTVLLCTNWLVYIWAVGNSLALEGSLGYFINPLVTVLLAVVFLGERLTKLQLLALLLAGLGVCYLIYTVGQIPIVALTLALSFGAYGLVRKVFAIDAFAGLTVETILATPFAIAYLIYLFVTDNLYFLHHTWQQDFLLLSAGAITTLPLLLFLSSLSLLRLSTVGLLQYIAPSMQFIVAVYILHEPFNDDKFIAFSLVWLGLIVFSVDILKTRRRNRLVQS